MSCGQTKIFFILFAYASTFFLGSPLSTVCADGATHGLLFLIMEIGWHFLRGGHVEVRIAVLPSLAWYFYRSDRNLITSW